MQYAYDLKSQNWFGFSGEESEGKLVVGKLRLPEHEEDDNLVKALPSPYVVCPDEDLLVSTYDLHVLLSKQFEIEIPIRILNLELEFRFNKLFPEKPEILSEYKLFQGSYAQGTKTDNPEKGLLHRHISFFNEALLREVLRAAEFEKLRLLSLEEIVKIIERLFIVKNLARYERRPPVQFGNDVKLLQIGKTCSPISADAIGNFVKLYEDKSKEKSDFVFYGVTIFPGERYLDVLNVEHSNGCTDITSYMTSPINRISHKISKVRIENGFLVGRVTPVNEQSSALVDSPDEFVLALRGFKGNINEVVEIITFDFIPNRHFTD